MREIKFRGMNGNRFVYGDLMHSNQDEEKFVAILTETYDFPVKKHTVGQFTSLYDKNGKEIYEGDLLKVSVMTRSLESVHPDHHYEKNFIDEVKFQHGYFYCKYFLWEIAANAEIIGNIYEHSHLLK